MPDGLRPEVSWLLSHPSPCLRARVRQWLLDLSPDHPSVLEDLAQYGRDPVLRTLLETQAADGSWQGPGLYCPKHRATFWVLGVLAEVGAGRRLPPEAEAVRRAVEKAAAFAFGFQACNGEVYQSRRAAGGRPSASKPVPCVTARLMTHLALLGYEEDDRVRAGAEHLAATQRPDGGWSCVGRSMPRRFESEKPCLGVTASFLELAQAVPGLRRRPVTARALDLVSSLYFKDPQGYHMGHTWPYLYYPGLWLDAAAAGRVLLSLGDGSAEARRCVEPGLAYLLSRRGPQGTWASDGHPYRPPVPPGRKGEPHPWVTLRVLRFLKAAGEWAPQR